MFVWIFAVFVFLFVFMKRSYAAAESSGIYPRCVAEADSPSLGNPLRHVPHEDSLPCSGLHLLPVLTVLDALAPILLVHLMKELDGLDHRLSNGRGGVDSLSQC